MIKSHERNMWKIYKKKRYGFKNPENPSGLAEKYKGTRLEEIMLERLKEVKENDDHVEDIVNIICACHWRKISSSNSL